MAKNYAQNMLMGMILRRYEHVFVSGKLIFHDFDESGNIPFFHSVTANGKCWQLLGVS